MKRTAVNNKILLLGVDGLDPRLMRKYVDEGKMPNVAKYIEKGACREDLVMLGGHPTVTPSMWTTLATGCYSNVHGITDFSRKGEDIDDLAYNMDSRLCQAEPLWNLFAESGHKTLVWHWPGSAWPPTSDSENLLVVDGSSPGGVNMSAAQLDKDFIVGASEEIPEATFDRSAVGKVDAVCVVTDLEDTLVKMEKESGVEFRKTAQELSAKGRPKTYIMSEKEGHLSAWRTPMDLAKSPIKPAKNWVNAPEDAKEFTILLSQGLIRRPALILKNEAGVYDRVAIYKSKKDAEPITVLEKGKLVCNIIDEAIKKDSHVPALRNMELLDIAEDGSNLRMWVSASMELNNDLTWHPKSLYKTIADNIGHPPVTVFFGNQDAQVLNDCMLHSWDNAAEWQSKALNYMIDEEGVEVIFSHFHAVDMQSHRFIRFMHDKGENLLPPETYQKFMEDVYVQTDWYLGQFMHRLDEGWTICIFSDHAQVCPKHNPMLIGEGTGVNIGVMEELGFTVLKKDENGKRLREIDWTKTVAVAQRANQIYLNMKGREKHVLPDGTILDGIVDPGDKYQIEEDIMTALYGYRHPVTGHRIIALALRNKDAVLLGMGGPECGDIVYWTAEGYNGDHSDSLATAYGQASTSVSPCFIGVGPGFKEGFYTDRIIRQIDFAPTIAVIGGMPMPAQCEGAPVYQILTEEY